MTGFVPYNTFPNWPIKYQPGPLEWQGVFGGKVDGTNGQALNLLINGGNVQGTIQSNNARITGTITIDNLIANISYPFLFAVSFGVAADGTTDDTAAWTATFAAATPKGATVVAPVGVSIVSALYLPSGVNLVGTPCNVYDGALSGGSILKRTDSTLTSSMLSVGNGNTIQGMAFYGANNTDGLNSGVSLASGSFCTIDNCNFYNLSLGVDCSYRQAILTRSHIHECGVGVNQPVDSRIENNYINGNTGPGIYCGTGANDNSIIGNKIEWNAANNILLYQCTNNNITGNTLDRSGLAGISMVSSYVTTITGNVIRRSGRVASGIADQDCHLKIQGCTGCIIMGNTTFTGADDDGTGYNSPIAALGLQQNTNTVVALNSWVCVGTTTPYGLYYLPNTILFGNFGLGDTVSQGVGTAAIQQGSAQLDVSTGASPTMTITYSPYSGTLPAFSVGLWIETTVYCRDAVSGARFACMLDIFISIEDSVATLQYTITNKLGSAFGPAGGTTTLTIAPAITTDGTSLTVIISNTSTTDYMQIEYMIQRFGNWTE